MKKKLKTALLVSLIMAQQCFAISVDDLKRGLDQAITNDTSATEIAI
ncbi:hypothetical protein [Paraburkholderia caledonica]